MISGYLKEIRKQTDRKMLAGRMEKKVEELVEKENCCTKQLHGDFPHNGHSWKRQRPNERQSKWVSRGSLCVVSPSGWALVHTDHVIGGRNQGLVAGICSFPFVWESSWASKALWPLSLLLTHTAMMTITQLHTNYHTTTLTLLTLNTCFEEKKTKST